MKGKINFDSYKNSGGVDSIEAKNCSGKDLLKYDQVIISEGDSNESNSEKLNVSSTYDNAAIADYGWPTIDTIYTNVRRASSTYPIEIYSRYKDVWYRYDTEKSICAGSGTSYYYTNDNILALYKYIKDDSGVIIDNKFNIITLPTYCIYIGSHNNHSYVAKKSTGEIFEYDHATNTLISSALYKAGVINFARIDNGRIILTSPTSITLLKFDTDNSIVLESSTTAENIYPRGITGLGIGDFLITKTKEITQYINKSDNIGELKLYCLNSVNIDGGLVYTEYTPETLSQFTTQACTTNFNNRNNLLTIGTSDNIYLYEFDKNTKNFTEIPLNLELTPNNDTALYRGCASPDGSEIIVGTIASNVITSKVYKTGYKQKTALLPHQENLGKNCHAGYVTEDATKNNMVQVSTINPYTVDLTINVSPSANNLTLIKGEN